MRCSIHAIVFSLLAPIVSLCIIANVHAQTLPSYATSLFAGPGDCQFCHAAGTGVLTSSAGEDISPPAHWRSSMMANASKDPFWQAKVTAETLAHPAIASVIENKCTTCHAPAGNRQSMEDGGDYYLMNTLGGDIPGLDGVTCTVCHQVQDNRNAIGDSFSGHYTIGGERLIFGPYEDPLTGQMLNRVNYTPVYSGHVESSELCATCHTLFTSYVDNNGTVGGSFPEQTPYLEWKNSVFPAGGTECQSCHMTAVDEDMSISLRPPFLATQRRPVWKHVFVGANTLMPAIMKKNATETGAYSGDNALDMTKAAAVTMLTDESVELSLDSFFDDTTLNADVSIVNICGHKFPAGYPSRQAWLNLTVRDSGGAVLFESGNPAAIDVADGGLTGFQPHYDVIDSPDKVQIYESVMGDVDGAVTATLLRASQYLKDNRIPPAGFSSTGPFIEDIAVIGAAARDGDFNRDDTGEGSGADTVHYRIPLENVTGDITVSATLYYRSISKRFADDLFGYDDPKIASFKAMYDAADLAPVPVKTVSATIPAPLGVDSGEEPRELMLAAYPNPFNPSLTIDYSLPDEARVSLDIFSSAGQKVGTIVNRRTDAGVHSVVWDASRLPSGLYFARLSAGDIHVTQKVTLVK